MNLRPLPKKVKELMKQQTVLSSKSNPTDKDWKRIAELSNELLSLPEFKAYARNIIADAQRNKKKKSNNEIP